MVHLPRKRDQGAPPASIRFDDDDVAAAGEGKEAVGRGRERRLAWPSSDERNGRHQQGDEEREDREHEDGPRDALAPYRDVHGKPPFEEGPRGPLSRATGLRDDVGEVIGPSRTADLVERGVQPVGREGARLRVQVAHAYRSVAAELTKSSSSATVIRIAASARLRRDFAVPTGMPNAAAVSGNERSR